MAGTLSHAALSEEGLASAALFEGSDSDSEPPSPLDAASDLLLDLLAEGRQSRSRELPVVFLSGGSADPLAGVWPAPAPAERAVGSPRALPPRKKEEEKRAKKVPTAEAPQTHVFPPQSGQHLQELARDQAGSRFLQQRLEVASDVDKQAVFLLVLPLTVSLAGDAFGNYVVQKMFEFGTAEQRRILAEQLVGEILRLSLHPYGCRVVQRAMDAVSIDQQMLIVGELKNHIIKCMEDQYGNHVAQRVIELLPADKLQFIIDSLMVPTTASITAAATAIDASAPAPATTSGIQRLAAHAFGCRVIQRLLEHCTHAQLAGALDELVPSVLPLAMDQYGNYVVQHLLVHGRESDRLAVMRAIRDNFLSFACHKYASNVVERALTQTAGGRPARPSDVQALVECVLGAETDPNPPLFTLMRDRYGNYIVQKMLEVAGGESKEALVWRLKEQIHVLKKFTYGKHVVKSLVGSAP